MLKLQKNSYSVNLDINQSFEKAILQKTMTTNIISIHALRDQQKTAVLNYDLHILNVLSVKCTELRQ